jgi:preprotein translocase subunit Sec63
MMAARELEDAYTILGLPVTATDADVRRQWKKLVFQWHPDKNPDPAATIMTQKLCNAFERIMKRHEVCDTNHDCVRKDFRNLYYALRSSPWTGVVLTVILYLIVEFFSSNKSSVAGSTGYLFQHRVVLWPILPRL